MNISSSKFAARRPVGLSLDVTPTTTEGEDYSGSLRAFKDAIKSVRINDLSFQKLHQSSGEPQHDGPAEQSQIVEGHETGSSHYPLSGAVLTTGHPSIHAESQGIATVCGAEDPVRHPDRPLLRHHPLAVDTEDSAEFPRHSTCSASHSAVESLPRDVSNAHLRTAGFSAHDLDSIEADNANFVSTVEELVPHAQEVSLQDVEIVVKLGTGCSSVVYLARHLVTGQLYALKLINLFDRSVRGMLFAELKALFTVDCETLISFFGVSLLEGQVACILEFMNLGGLDTVLRRIPSKSLPEKQLACVAQQVLWGLGYLSHERRVHRDVKPQNILVNSKGEVKLTDFGLSRLLETAMLANTFVGSFRYMSPERVLHEPYGASADVWSLGMVLLEAAMGRFPYDEADSGSQVAMLMTLSEGHPPKIPDEIKKTFSPEFIHFISCCLQRDPEKRWSAVALLQHDWLINQGAVNIEASSKILEAWFEENGISDVFASEEL